MAETLHVQAKARGMKAGAAGLAEGHQPHMRDAAVAWASVTPRDFARYRWNVCRARGNIVTCSGVHQVQL